MNAFLPGERWALTGVRVFNRTFKNISQTLGALCHRGATEEDGLKMEGKQEKGGREKTQGEREGIRQGEYVAVARKMVKAGKKTCFL